MLDIKYQLLYVCAFFLSLILNYIARYIYIAFERYDVPNEIKTHSGKIPHSGGVAVFISVVITLFIIRFATHFPTGTLRELRYILIGSFLIFLIGIIDDFKKPKGIRAEVKFFIEVLIGIFMITRGFSIKFIMPTYIAYFLSVIWIVGITNALNIIDIMDGLCASQIIIASVAFYFITLPQEELYVNILAGTLGWAVLGFLPYNMSNKNKVFLGDSGSLFCGFILSVISLGAQYSEQNPLGVYAPVFILSLPIFDTFYVSYLRLKKGISPFQGSKDHFALRLETLGYSRKKIVMIASVFSVFTSFISFMLTRVDIFTGVFLFAVVAIFLFISGKYLSRVKVV